MSTQPLFHRSLAFALTLTVAGVASARRPPQLAAAQEHASQVLATCAQSHAQATSGYRDMLARAPATSAGAQRLIALPLPAPRKMGNHLVLVCTGGEIHQGSGYRDFPVRFPTESSVPQLAQRTRLVADR